LSSTKNGTNSLPLNALEQWCKITDVAPEAGYVVCVRLGAQVGYSARDVYDEGTEFLVRAAYFLAQGASVFAVE
jgi:hypothetical protein